MTTHEGDLGQLQAGLDRPNFGPSQVQSADQLKPGYYLYHKVVEGSKGQPTEVAYSLKILGVARDGENALLQWRGIDGEPHMDDFPLFKLGLIQGANGEWYSGGWLEDPAKKA